MKRRRRLATLGLIALVVVDLVLVFAGLRFFGRPGSTEASKSTASLPQAPESLSTAAPEPSSTSSSSTTTSSAPAPPVTPLTAMISAVDGSVAWRVTTGNGAVVSRIEAADATHAFIIDGDANCVMGTRTTADGGTN